MPDLVTRRYTQHDGGFVFRPAEVIRTQTVTPNMIRVTFGGPELQHVVSHGPDDDIRIQFPEDFRATPLPPVVAFEPFRLVYPDDAPPSQIRAYTIRRLNARAGELDIDFALHANGIATRWAAQARPGQRVTIGGPRGSSVILGEVDSYLFAGDATALPAIGRFIEELPAGAQATLVVEVDGVEEQQAWDTAPGVCLTSHWVDLNGALAGRTALLEDAVRALPRPSDRCFIFAAGESATMRRLRRQMVADWGIERNQFSISGYWKHEDDEAPHFVDSEDDVAGHG